MRGPNSGELRLHLTESPMTPTAGASGPTFVEQQLLKRDLGNATHARVAVSSCRRVLFGHGGGGGILINCRVSTCSPLALHRATPHHE
jgi:hypothetical protein